MSSEKTIEREKTEPGAILSGISQVAYAFSSLRLTVVFLCFAVLLVFIGTLAQTNEGLFAAQNRYFRSFFVFWSPAGLHWKIPVFPGGYLIGGVLLINLLAAHARRFTFTKKKIGIFIIHAGIVLLLLGQFATDMLSTESTLQLFEGDAIDYSEDFHANELVIIDTSNPEQDRVYSIPESFLSRHSEISDASLPFTVRVKKHWPNADLSQTKAKDGIVSGATDGAFKDFYVLPHAPVIDSEKRNFPAAVVEIVGEKGLLGTFLVYAGIMTRQQFVLNGKPYEIALRFTRHYYPFRMTLLKATHEKYKGTDIPKNFASRVRVENPSRGEARETVIYMNNPLRYGGLTFFQYQMSADEAAMRAGQRPSSTFEVVRNPSWLTPYLSCVMVAAGLIIQFMSHLIGFATKRRAA